jgi:hypothetical protein
MQAAAASSLEKAEETFSKQLSDMQALLSDYQTQVCPWCDSAVWRLRVTV